MLKKILTFLTLLIIAYPAISSLLKPGYFPIHDDIQTMRLHQMDKCIKDLQIPCRWVPDMGFGYGYPQFNYYGPFPYYVMEVFHLVGFSIIDSVKIGFALALILSGFGMYLLARSVWNSRTAGLLSSLFYIYFPYHAVNVYVRGAMGETWALAIIPFIFYSLYELVNNQNKQAVVYLALSIFGLITSHNVTTLIFVPFCALWFIYLNFRQNKRLVLNFKRVAFGGVWGIGLSAFFLLPAWFEKKYVHVETITQGYFNYLAHFVGLKQLLISSYWGYGSSELGDFDGLSLSVGILWWMLPIVALILFIVFRMRETKKLSLLVVLGWISLFMVHPKSVVLWQQINLLSFIQFPWRFLGIALFFFSLAIGSLMLVIPKRKTMFIISSIAVIGFYSGFFAPSKYLDITDNDKFTGKSWQMQQTISIFDYLPIFAEFPPSVESPNTIVSDSRLNIVFDESGSDWRRWEMEVFESNTKIKLPILYFPGWSLSDNGTEIDIISSPKTGLIEAMLSPGQHSLFIELKNTPIRTVSNIISLLAILLIVFHKKYYE